MEALPAHFSAPSGLLRARLAEEYYPIVYANDWLREHLPEGTALMHALRPRMRERLQNAIDRTAGDGSIELELEIFSPRNQIGYLLLHGRVHDGYLDAAVLDITAWRTGGIAIVEHMTSEASSSFTQIITYEINLTRDRVTETNSSWYYKNMVPEDMTYSGLLRTACEKAVCPTFRARFMERLGLEEALRAFEEGKRVLYTEYLMLNGGQEPVWLEGTMNMLRNRTTGDICGLLHIKNISQRKKQEQELRRRAERDELTGVLNRQATRARIDSILAEGIAEGRRCALLMIDLDNFKQINDTYGHVQGDSVLTDFATRLRGIFRETDVIGRLGGDEFAILIRDIPHKETAAGKAAQVCSAMCTGDEEISGSVGIAFSPDDGATFDELYYKADIALYRAKRQGKNCCAIYDRDEDMS